MPVAGRSTTGSVSIIVEMLCVERLKFLVDAVVPGGNFHVAFHGQVTLFLVAADDVVKFFNTTSTISLLILPLSASSFKIPFIFPAERSPCSFSCCKGHLKYLPPQQFFQADSNPLPAIPVGNRCHPASHDVCMPHSQSAHP